MKGLAELRKAKGLTQQELADLAAVSRVSAPFCITARRTSARNANIMARGKAPNGRGWEGVVSHHQGI